MVIRGGFKLLSIFSVTVPTAKIMTFRFTFMSCLSPKAVTLHRFDCI